MNCLFFAASSGLAHTNSVPQLVIAALAGIVTIVLLIVWRKMHPFLALTLGSAVLALVAAIPLPDTFAAFTKGLGSTVGGVGVLIAFGAIIGKLLIDSGGADQIVDTVLSSTSTKVLPWAMALVAFVVGIPLFFEVGIVLLIPVVMLVARRAKMPVIAVGIPALAGLSALHGLVPPHPGPLIAIDALKANIGLTLGLGLLVAVPTVVVSGPLAARLMVRWVPRRANSLLGGEDAPATEGGSRPSFGVAISVVLLPVVLMLARTVVEMAMRGAEASFVYKAFEFVGEPLVALLLTVLYSMLVLGRASGRSVAEVNKLVGSSLAPIASILLIVGAGGGFKETLVESGIAQVIAQWIEQLGMPILLAGWIVAVAVRLATGSATVATITASGIMAPMATTLPPAGTALLVLAIGAGSVFLSHVNDAGVWLVKEYFGMSVGETFKTWSLMETILSVTGLLCILALAIPLGV
ncbi:gluconate transporter [Actinomyces sp. HMSC072A03]|nr:gluconate transporter [Actinomyces sp. HMSC072A03]